VKQNENQDAEQAGTLFCIGDCGHFLSLELAWGMTAIKNTK